MSTLDDFPTGEPIAASAASVLLQQIVIPRTDGRPLVTIHLADGSIEYGPDYEPDEAAAAFWEALRRQAAGPEAVFGRPLYDRINAELARGQQAEVALARARAVFEEYEGSDWWHTVPAQRARAANCTCTCGRHRAALGGDGEPTETEPAGAVKCDHNSPNLVTWFDRSICPEPCGAAHTRCTACGAALTACGAALTACGAALDQCSGDAPC